MSSGFVGYFGITVIHWQMEQKMFMVVKGPRGALYLWVRDWDHFVCCCLIEQHVVCDKIMLIYALLMDVNYM